MLTRRNIVGAPAAGIDFFGRDKEVAQCWHAIEDGENLLIVAPRRSGVTSLLFKLHETASENQYASFYVSAEGAESPLRFVSQLFTGARSIRQTEDAVKEALASVKKNLPGVKSVSVSTSGLKWELDKGSQLQDDDWKVIGESLLRSLSNANQPLLVIIDSLECFLGQLERDETENDLREFLQWFRWLRTTTDLADNIHWVVAAETSLQGILERASCVSAFNDFSYLTLNPLDDDVAADFVYSLCASYEDIWDKEIRSHFLTKLGPSHPYYIQVLFRAVRDRMAGTEKPVSKDLIDKAYEDVTDLSSRSLFPQLLHSLQESYATQSRRLVESLLAVLAEAESPLPLKRIKESLNIERGDKERSSLVGGLLKQLLADQFVSKQDDGYALMFRPVRDHLRKYYALTTHGSEQYGADQPATAVKKKSKAWKKASKKS